MLQKHFQILETHEHKHDMTIQPDHGHTCYKQESCW